MPAYFKEQVINIGYTTTGQEKPQDIGKWVGCISPPPAKANVLHEVKLGIGRDNNIHASVRLFARYGTPEYRVIVGPAP